MSQADDTLRILLRDLAKESVKPTLRRVRPGRRPSYERGTASATQPMLTPRLLVALSIVYGGLIAILSILDFDSLGMLAAVGGVVVGVLWAWYGIFGRKPS